VKSEDLVALSQANVVTTIPCYGGHRRDRWIELNSKPSESGITDSEGIVKYWNTLSKYRATSATTLHADPAQRLSTDEVVMSEALPRNGTFAVARVH